jgi:gas vesicle protein
MAKLALINGAYQFVEEIIEEVKAEVVEIKTEVAEVVQEVTTFVEEVVEAVKEEVEDNFNDFIGNEENCIEEPVHHKKKKS